MSGVELSVAAIAAVLGYVVISALWPDKKRPGSEPPGEPAAEPWHVTLGVRSDATVEEIQRAYRERMAQHPPQSEMAARIATAYGAACRARGMGL